MFIKNRFDSIIIKIMWNNTKLLKDNSIININKFNTLNLNLYLNKSDVSYGCNHLLFIDDLKLFSESDNVLKLMVNETKEFFRTVGLEMNIDKSATNSVICEDDAKLLGSHEGYKYLGITESRVGKNMTNTVEKIVNSIESRVETLCKTRLNAKNLIRAITYLYNNFYTYKIHLS
ncbi:reverse transcriptase [Vairimorpha apis BRL 01]|uniref:Reverse transcriptase n=1 Tax=Vairimorpha apis BRL 01 TaxID=1037528 RepID=T0L6H4_9MICR|nr:reverse transcriptase [Vairimorpha apis BRL 01]